MNWKNNLPSNVGVLGAGRFGTVIANLLARNVNVTTYVRNQDKATLIAQNRSAAGQKLLDNIAVTSDLKFIAERCKVLFPIIPSYSFKALLEQLKPFLKPDHIIIHGIKGLELTKDFPSNIAYLDKQKLEPVTRDEVKTMSELIKATTGLTQIGCISGPNLATELIEGQLAAIVIASTSPQVMELGKKLLKGDHFQVYTNGDTLGVELCGVLKNIVAIGAGCLAGLGYGENTKAFLISRGLGEMIHIGKLMGATLQPFLGLAGIGDLVATCASKLSRNYTVGYRLAKGEALPTILSQDSITAEGVRTVWIIHSLMTHHKLKAPITEMMYQILFEASSVQIAIQHLMEDPSYVDVDFMSN